MKIEEIIELCYKYYPLGTVYISAYDKAIGVYSNNESYTIYKSPIFEQHNADAGDISIKNIHSLGLLYYNGYWADIINDDHTITDVELKQALEIIYKD